MQTQHRKYTGIRFESLLGRSVLDLNLDSIQFIQVYLNLISWNTQIWVCFGLYFYWVCFAFVSKFSHSGASEMLSPGSVSKLSTSVLLIRNKTHNTNNLCIGADEERLSSDSFVHTAMNRLPCMWTCCNTDLFLDAKNIYKLKEYKDPSPGQYYCVD